MEAYPPQYVEHNLPLVLLSGLETAQAADQTRSQPRRQENGAKIINESPTCQSERSAQLLQQFAALDGTGKPWNSTSLPGPMGTIRYKFQSVGRTYTLPARKAAPLPQSPDAGGGPLSRNSELHSPLSPLSPGSPIFPDGLFTPLWFSKHQEQVPCLFIAFFDFNVGDSSIQDEQIKTDINAIRNALTRSGFKPRYAAVLLGNKSILHAPEFEDRLSAIRRATGLDPKNALFFMPPMTSQAEMSTFVQGIMMTLQPSVVEYYRDLTKHARRKKTRGGPSAQISSQNGHASHLIPSSGWNVRYEVKQGVFAEFRQEMDVAERHYLAAIEELFSPEGIFETTASWNPRWDQARLLCDAMAMRILRCHLWNAQTVAATQFWMTYKLRCKDMVDRRGKGSLTYAWDAWEARWAGVLSQLIFLAKVAGLQRPEQIGAARSTPEVTPSTVYAIPEKAFSPADRLVPFNLLHHSGYWLKLFATGIRARWAKALALPEEDRVPPGQSPASTMVMRSKSYDTYLVCEPHDEFPLSGPGRYDYVAELGAVTARATEEFESRGQTRMTEQMHLDHAHDLVRAGRMIDATQTLTRLWEESSWREDVWHNLFVSVLRLLLNCLGQDKSPEFAHIMPALTWELLSLKLSDVPDKFLDISKCLDEWNLAEKVMVELQDKQRLCPISVSFAFKRRESHVGEPILFQLTLEYAGTDMSKQIDISRVDVRFESSKTIILKHKSDMSHSPSTGYRFEALKLDEHDDDTMVAVADLRIMPGQSRIYDLDLVLRQAQVLRATQVSLLIDAAKFSLSHAFSNETLQPTPVWYLEQDDDVEKILLPHVETQSINVLPKPPKMQLELEGLLDHYYIDEKIRLSVNLVNGEAELVDATIIPTVGGSGDNSLEFILDDADDSNVGRTISGMKPSATLETDLVLHAPSEASTFSLSVELKYSLRSDPNTPLSKTITAELSFVAAFDAKFIFGPVYNPDPWPSYFDSHSEGSEEVPDGITQRWSLGARIASLAAEVVTLQKSEILLKSVEGDALCKVGLTSLEAMTNIRSLGRVLSPFELTTQKISLDDRRPTYLDLSLVLTWTRDGIPGATTTAIPVPRLTVPSSEPRVLCTVTDGGTDGVDAVIQYHLENPSGHFLTFALTMEANDDFAFSGPKYRTLSLAPLSRHCVDYQILLQPHAEGNTKDDDGIWVSPVFHVVDSYYQKNLRVQPGGYGVKLNEKREPTVLIAETSKTLIE